MHTELIHEVTALLSRSGRPFWLAGGHAIDLFVGRVTRSHDDLDFVIRRVDQLVVQEALGDWDLHAADRQTSRVTPNIALSQKCQPNQLVPTMRRLTLSRSQRSFFFTAT